MSNILNKNKNCDDKIDFSVARSISGGKDESTPDKPCSSKQQISTAISSSNSSSKEKSDEIIHLPNNNCRKQTSFEASNSSLTLNSSKTSSSYDTFLNSSRKNLYNNVKIIMIFLFKNSVLSFRTSDSLHEKDFMQVSIS